MLLFLLSEKKNVDTVVLHKCKVLLYANANTAQFCDKDGQLRKRPI